MADPLVAPFNLEAEPAIPGVTLDDPWPVIADTEVVPPISRSVAEARALKQHIGLGPQSPGKEHLAQYAGTALEYQHRRKVALERDEAVTSTKAKMVESYLADLRDKGVTPNQDHIDYIKQLTFSDLSNPDTIYEQKFAEFMGNRALDRFQQKPLNEQMEQVAFKERQKDGTDIAFEHMIIKDQWAANKLEDLEARFSSQRMGEKVLDYIETIVPAASWWNLTNLNKTGGFGLPGNMIQERISRYNLLPPEEAIKEMNRDIEEMWSANPVDAIDFMRYLRKFSSQDQMLQNILLGGSDLSTAASIGKAVALFGMAKGLMGTRGIHFATAYASSGHTTAAAALHIHKDLQDMINATPKGAGFESLRASAWSMFGDLDTLLGPSSTLSATQRSHLMDVLKKNQETLIEGAYLRPITIERLVPGSPSWDAAMVDTERMMNKVYTGVPSHAINHIRHVSETESITGTNHMIWQIGKKDTADPIHSKHAAMIWARDVYGLKDGSYRVVNPLGSGWYIEVSQAVDETALSVRNALQLETKNATPGGRFSTFGRGLLRSKDDILPTEISTDMKVATYGSSGLTKLMQEVAAPIAALKTWSKKSNEKFHKFVEYQRDYIDPLYGDRGKFSRTFSDFEKDWMHVNKVLPDAQETAAYLTYVQMNDIDWLMRNQSIYRDKTRQGIQLINFPLEPAVVGPGTKPYVEGKLVPNVDYDQVKSAMVLIWDPAVIGHSNKMTHRPVQFFNRKKDLDSLLAKGYKVYQLTNYGNEALWNTMHKSGKTLGEMMDVKHVTYVFAKDANMAPLSMRQIPHRPGGHVAYPDRGLFVSQANIQSKLYNKQNWNTYIGDVNILHFPEEKAKDAAKFAGFYDEGRKLLKAGKDAQAKLLIEGATPHTFDEFKGWFHPKTGRLSLDHEILVREKGKSLEDQHKISSKYTGIWEDLRDSPYNLYNSQVNMQYASKRGDTMYTMANTGTEDVPIWSHKPTKLIDPVAAMDSITDKMMQGRYMDDLKFKMAERFLAEFGNVLEDSASKMARDPFGTLVEGRFKKDHADKELLAKAQNFRRSTLEFLGLKTDLDKSMEYALEKTLKGLMGEKWGGRTANWMISSELNPVKFMRSVAFHEKIGLLNPVQLTLQAQTTANIVGMEGLNGIKGVAAYVPTRAAMWNPKHTDAMAKVAGWDPVHFRESLEGLRRSGMMRVGGEHAYADDFVAPKMVRGSIKSALDAGLVFFQEGELITRVSAWNAAYLRWRGANPAKKFDDRAMREVLARTDLLTMNMSRASAATWQTGLMSVPTQFWSYNARVMEQLLGKRLTGWEKARVTAVYSGFYGMPVAAGAWAGFWPVTESVRQALVERNINYDSNVVSKVLMDGIPSMLLEGYQYMAGTEKPTKFDVGTRLGPGGNPFLRDWMYGKKDFLEVVGGVSTSSFKDTLTHLVGPMMRSVLASTREQDEWYPLTLRDFRNAANQVSSLNQAGYLYDAMAMNKYFDKNEGLIDDKLTAGEASLIFFGLKPQRLNEAWTLIDSKKSMDEHKRKYTKEYIKNLQLAYRATTDEERIMYFKRATASGILGWLTEQEKSIAANRSLKGHESLIEKAEQDFLNSGDPAKSAERLQLYIERSKQRN